MKRNRKIKETLLEVAIAVGACSKAEKSNRTPKVVNVSMPTPAADKPVDIRTAPKVTGPISYVDGEALFQAGKYLEATNVFEQYTVEKPNNPWGHFMLGLSQSKTGDTEKAEKAFE